MQVGRLFGYRGRIVSRNDLLFLDIQLLMLLSGDSACQETARGRERIIVDQTSESAHA